MPDFNQGEFDFSGDEAGYRNWQRELEKKKKAFERRHGLRLGQRVRLQLRGFAKPIEGVISIDGCQSSKENAPPRLRIGTLVFVAGACFWREGFEAKVLG